MHLVSWDIFKRPILEGGLQIRDPGLANMAMRRKLIWKLYMGKNHPVSNIFRMKYIKGVSLRNLSTSRTPTRTTIQNSCRKGIGKFKKHIYRISRNGKKILLWEDKTSGNPSLSSISFLSEIMDWSTNKGLLHLVDFCSWDNVGNWVGWSFPDLPH